jgi:hypothetical protein
MSQNPLQLHPVVVVVVVVVVAMCIEPTELLPSRGATPSVGYGSYDSTPVALRVD